MGDPPLQQAHTACHLTLTLPPCTSARTLRWLTSFDVAGFADLERSRAVRRLEARYQYHGGPYHRYAQGAVQAVDGGAQDSRKLGSYREPDWHVQVRIDKFCLSFVLLFLLPFLLFIESRHGISYPNMHPAHIRMSLELSSLHAYMERRAARSVMSFYGTKLRSPASLAQDASATECADTVLAAIWAICDRALRTSSFSATTHGWRAEPGCDMAGLAVERDAINASPSAELVEF